jgi:hypothetical protein
LLLTPIFCPMCPLPLGQIFFPTHQIMHNRDRKRTDPNRTKTVRFGSSRSEPNSNRFFENALEPNRTELILEKWIRTEPNSNHFLKNDVEPIRSEPILEIQKNINKRRRKIIDCSVIYFVKLSCFRDDQMTFDRLNLISV